MMHRYPTKTLFLYLFLATFALRAVVFYCYVQHEERYRQADTMDYHNCAVGIALGTGMHRADNLKPIFWRTPGYPLLLGAVYKWCGIQSARFSQNHYAHKLFLWTQITLCSFTPIILFYLALSLTASLCIAYLLALIAVFHPGLILASMYMLTEGIALMLFYLFLLFLYKSFSAYGQPTQASREWARSIALAALFLGAYTWIRPMGKFVSIASVIILACTAVDPWRLTFKKAVLFLSIFAFTLMPWYLRNHALTGHWFFCPMGGAYLNSFTAPKIVRTLNDFTLEKSIGICYYLAEQEIKKEEARLSNSPYSISRELIAGRVAWPIVQNHPWLALKEWIKEVFKTAFDLYSCQLAALAAGTFMYDPLEEFLTVKVADTVWHQSMPCLMRIVVWLELVFTLLLWLGLCAGFWLFMLKPLIRSGRISAARAAISGLWLKTAPLIWAVFFMTGGFGYARLRLPVEPLMIILSLTWWLYKNKQSLLHSDHPFKKRRDQGI